MLVALRWMSQGGRSRHSLTLLLCTDCTAVWAPPLSDRVADLGPISPTCVLPLLDNTALMYYVFHIVRSRIKLCKISYSKSVIPAGSDYSQPAGCEVISPFTTSELAGVVKVFLFSPLPLRELLSASSSASATLHQRQQLLPPLTRSFRHVAALSLPLSWSTFGQPPVCGFGSRCARH